MKFVLIILMFFVLGSLLIISNNTFYLNDSEDINNFQKLWLDWFEGVFSNFKTMVEDIITIG
ncbi:MAG: hypothetical protein ABIH59_02835 [archaeon]